MKQNNFFALVSVLMISSICCAQDKQTVIDGMKEQLKGLGSTNNVFEKEFDHLVLDRWREPLNNAQSFVAAQASENQQLIQAAEKIITSYNTLGQKIQEAYAKLFAPNVTYSTDVYSNYKKQFVTIDNDMTKLRLRLKAMKLSDQSQNNARDALVEAADYVRLLAEKTEQDFKHKEQ